MSRITYLVVFSVLCYGCYCYDSDHHRHRHAKSHSSEYDLDNLLNRLDGELSSSAKPAEATHKPPKKDIFEDFDRPVSHTSLVPGNSLWDDDSGRDLSTVSPLDSKRWENILKKDKDKEKHQEELDDMDDQDEEEEDLFEDQQEQVDLQKPLSSRDGQTYTDWKWQQMGSRKSVDNLFKVYRSGLLRPDSATKDSQAQFEVFRHSKLMAKETLCRWPRPKVVRVADVYPSTSKLYVPPCTVLHQCGDDTGCCGGTSQRCGPKTTKRVELYFYYTNKTTYIVSANNHQRPFSGLEKLPFYNHTECGCIDRLEEVMPRDGGQATDFRGDKSLENVCKCPSEFTVRRLANGSCRCDCFDKQHDCIKYKRGKEYFNHSDRLCIEMDTCQQPACDFGAYLRSSGRCPRKHEKFRSRSRFHH